MEFRTLAGVVGIALVLIYAIGSGIWVSTSPGWYTSLIRPPWQPPDFVFGIIWPYNFTVLGITAWQVARTQTARTIAIFLSIFALSIVAALMWAYHFYVPHNLNFAAYSLAAAALLTIPLLVIAYRVSWKLGLLLTPYQLWVTIATTLAWGYASRN